MYGNIDCKEDVMNHNILKQVIFDQHEFIKNVELIDREYSFEKNVNYILVGLRRAGKSTLLYKMVKDLISEGLDWSQMIYVNFEDDRLLGFSKDDFNDIVEIAHELADNKEIYYFFDEIQIIDGWEHFARRLADQKKHGGADAGRLPVHSWGQTEKRLTGREGQDPGAEAFRRHGFGD